MFFFGSFFVIIYFRYFGKQVTIFKVITIKLNQEYEISYWRLFNYEYNSLYHKMLTQTISNWRQHPQSKMSFSDVYFLIKEAHLILNWQPWCKQTIMVR